jgi:hypothetical protein
MDNIWRPIQFFYGFDHALGKKNGPFIVIRKKISVFIGKGGLPFKIFLVIDKINLYPFPWNGGYLYDQWHVHIIDDQIHARQPDHLMKLVPALVDITEPGHKDPNLASIAVDHSRGFVRH